MSEVRWGLAGQASEPGVSCQSEAVSALDRAASTEWRLLNNGHIWSEYAEVAGHGLLLSGHQNSPCTMVPPGQKTSCFRNLRESGDWERDLQGHGEKAQVSFLHITSVATGHTVPCS